MSMPNVSARNDRNLQSISGAIAQAARSFKPSAGLPALTAGKPDVSEEHQAVATTCQRCTAGDYEQPMLLPQLWQR